VIEVIAEVSSGIEGEAAARKDDEARAVGSVKAIARGTTAAEYGELASEIWRL
jgi:hypothetical protein